jgi:alcohol dehydrogenase, propanol-preferring
MRAWELEQQRPAAERPMRLIDKPRPEPQPGEVLVRVRTCGVCRTDLHIVEGDLQLHRSGVTPGHEVVGVVEESCAPASDLAPGDRVGIAWLRHTCGTCRFCSRGSENLCLTPLFTGWDADGGYADYATIDANYAYRLPDAFDDETAAPLLCAGIIGFRALRQSKLPRGGRLGIWGFGGSAHLAAQVAMSEGAEVHVRTRDSAARRLARDLGAASVGDSADELPAPLDSAILFAPAGALVPVALAALDRGGTLAVAGIHLSTIPPLDYQAHLFEERRLRSVTANTRADGQEFLRLAAEIGIKPTTTAYPLEHAAEALADLAADRVTGAAVLRVAE